VIFQWVLLPRIFRSMKQLAKAHSGLVYHLHSYQHLLRVRTKLDLSYQIMQRSMRFIYELKNKLQKNYNMLVIHIGRRIWSGKITEVSLKCKKNINIEYSKLPLLAFNYSFFRAWAFNLMESKTIKVHIKLTLRGAVQNCPSCMTKTRATVNMFEKFTFSEAVHPASWTTTIKLLILPYF
jgi:hypothetical protein